MALKEGGIFKNRLKNFQINVRFNDGRRTKKDYRSIKPSDLATADGQKNYRGGKKLGRGGKNPPGRRKIVATKKMVVVKKYSLRELDRGRKIDASFRHWLM